MRIINSVVWLGSDFEPKIVWRPAFYQTELIS
jgi:hypothetical protein